MTKLNQIHRLAETALKQYELEVETVEFIKHRENAVYKVTDKTGQKFALRIHRLDYHSDRALESEAQWMASLNEYGVSNPPVIRSKNGDTFVKAQLPGLKAHQCDLLGWVSGAPMGSIEDGVEGDLETLTKTYTKIGEMAAKVHNHGDQWQRPADFDRHAWDEDGFTGESPFWGRYWKWHRLSHSEQNLFLTARTKLRNDLISFGKEGGKYGLIHADLLPENLLCNGDTINLIDFDDGGFGWRLYDLATALFFQLGEEHFDDILNSYITGYRRHRSLPDEDLSYLSTFLVARGLSICGWLHSRGEPDDVKDIVEEIKAGVIALVEDYIC